MATIRGGLERVVHDVANALLDNGISTKLSESVTKFVASGFGIVDDVLKIARDLTKPDAPTSDPPQT